MMAGGTALVVCADAELTQKLVAGLSATGCGLQTSQARCVAEALKILVGLSPQVILVDESAMLATSPRYLDLEIEGNSLESSVAALTEHAPVVLISAAHHHEPLSFLIGSGAVDLVARIGDFVPIAVGLVARRLRLGERLEAGACTDDEEADFGDMLRHEVNNPLTGILGNAELLLSRRDNLSPKTIARIETIAELAMRLRETVRRLSDTWALQRDHAHTA
ncbi:MAG TPA: histidine kinase dimerization/phospho-acceptor domain-containing protein [Candidatus Acidoferrales bacterium]|nr:histidine kinase dimerization/phospho-acceptor domain-containing protein [Candidatus Acidoferrales bacterium]